MTLLNQYREPVTTALKAAAVKPNESPTEVAIEQLEREVTALESLIDQLRQQLSAVLAPGGITETQPPGTAPGSSPLVNKLHEINNRINLMSKVVSDILARLEL